MTSLLSWPFRLTPNGSAAVRDDGDPEYLSEELAQMIMTEPGERELVPTYGLNDAVYGTFDEASLAAQVEVFGPPVRIEKVETTVVSDGESDVTVAFSQADTDDLLTLATGEDEEPEF